MPRTAPPQLCELHAHSTWSDGALDLPALVDLYGGAGFDVLAVTDHVHRSGACGISAASFTAYLAAVEAEAERAATRYGLLVIPGVELTYDDADARRAAHVLALGLRSFVGLNGGLDAALGEAREKGAALIGAHPYTLAASAGAPRA
ncbi:MAG TPA: PHP domain-containing protein, partial [Gaiellaceae bacterium]